MGKENKNGNKIKLNWISWIIYITLASLPTILFTVVIPFYGDVLKITKKVGEETRFTAFGIILTLVIAVVMLLVTYYRDSYQVKTEVDDLRYEVLYLRTITDKFDQICGDKYTQLQRSITEVKANKTEPPLIISEPSHQLKIILDGIKSCLVEFLKTPGQTYYFRDFYVTLTYNFPQENDVWEWTDGTTEKDMTLEELLADGAKSTFNYLRSSKKPYYFNNQKEEAKREDRYLFNPQDELLMDNGEPAGSIFCYNFKIIKGNMVYIDAMLSISTQKKRFAPENDKKQIENARDNLVFLVREHFGKRIGIELCLLYLEYISKREK